MTGPLKIRVAVLPEAQPVLDALMRLHVDIGTMRAKLIFPDAPPDIRLIAVALVDEAALHQFRLDLSLELVDKPEAAVLASRIALITAPLESFLVIFRDVIAIEA